ncbi:glutamine synthetase [Tissierella sp. Yu-01]|uniref:glutamine synthetase n=1 Tax=Tissierella sp. Yu-01 TaxID=3035694 RepID=UPI00240D35A3|nr:glutamine synthetase [Tissierella sp. Yu-01]WFA08835.1 glutamine synthetase [Tissierella sp. Yu-01]
MNKNLIYVIGKDSHDKDALTQLLSEHNEIKFVSLSGVDLIGHETEEKIPVKIFIEDMDTFLNGIAVQTDGSSVYLPTIATLDNAKIDMKVDLDRNWFVEYNYDNIDEETGLPVGTLIMPCYLYHDGIPVDSRHILLNSTKYFEESILDLLNKNTEILKSYDFTSDDIAEIRVTAATELEFWVMTPNDSRNIEELSTSQELHEQYWAKVRGSVRTAMEQTLEMMGLYGFDPEMGHKEVGGVKSRLEPDGSLTGIMEQLEIDWKYSSTIQTGDNELFVKRIIKEVFRRNGMEVTFLAKPIPGVAGSGEHTHIGVTAKLKSGKLINLFHPIKETYMSVIGFGALMGILKNYEVMNPFITSSNEAFKRLKKGFEAPICIVTSLGKSPKVPSRNRTVLIGLIRDEYNPLATRFELRSPNPHSNTYLCIATMILAMLDGIEYAVRNRKSEEELLAELSKKPGEDSDYLEKDRAYRSEVDVFDDFTDEEREKYFGKVPSTVYENVSAFEEYSNKVEVLIRGNVLSEKLLTSYRVALINKWLTEIEHRILPSLANEILNAKALHDPQTASDLDISNWMKIRDLRIELMKDSFSKKSLFTIIKDAINKDEYETVSDLQKRIYNKMEELRGLYTDYRRNLLDF